MPHQVSLPLIQLITRLANTIMTLVLLLNLLIARMSSTHQRINDAAMEEWSFFVAKTVQQQILLKERSPLCMLPSPLNLVTTAVAPLHYPLMRKGISLAGSVADRMLTPLGQMQTYFFLLYLFVKRLLRLLRYRRSSGFQLVSLVVKMVCFLLSSLLATFTLTTTR